MTENCVVVAGGTHARFFTLEKSSLPEMEPGPNLVEVTGLIHPEKDLHSELWSDKKTGRNRAPKGAGAHGYDDHRNQHEDETERRFARDVAEQAARLAKAHQVRNVTLVAHKRMLGFLRNALAPLMKAGVEVQEVPKDLVKLTAHELHEHLSRDHIIPGRKNPNSR
jgi:protein required for attachment to host cells